MITNRLIDKCQILFFILMSFLVMSSPVLAATYYISKNGNNSNSGTDVAPWLTIQKAADTMQAGDVVLIKEGIYREQVRTRNSGNVDNYITYQNFPGHMVIIDGENGSRETCISVKANYVRFIGIKLIGASRAGFYASGPSSNIILEGLVVENNNFGINFNAYDQPITDSSIKNCQIRNNNNHGIFLYRRNYDILIDNNHVSYSAWNSDWGHNIKVVVWNHDNKITGPNRITITNNEIDHARVQGIMTWNARDLLIKGNHCHHNGASGIQIEDGSNNVIVEGNVCEYNAQKYDTETGIWIDDSEHVLVNQNTLRHNKIGLLISKTSHCIAKNNLIYKNDVSNVDPSGLLVVQYDRIVNRDTILVHNTIYKNGNGSHRADAIALGTWGQIESVVVKNNIIIETNSTYDLHVNSVSYTSDYNNYYNDRELSINWNGSVNTWEQYKSNSGQDSHSLSENPMFINPQNTNFQLQIGSPCIDKGIHLTQTTSAGSGKTVEIKDARYFTSGFGLTNGDSIIVGTNTAVTIIQVDYNLNTITVDREIHWNGGDTVSYFYSGSAPDMGAFEYRSTDSLPDT